MSKKRIWTKQSIKKMIMVGVKKSRLARAASIGQDAYPSEIGNCFPNIPPRRSVFLEKKRDTRIATEIAPTVIKSISKIEMTSDEEIKSSSL